jgi:lactate dehydrogenase-like 2-hydroxyacid dehydrogenase
MGLCVKTRANKCSIFLIGLAVARDKVIFTPHLASVTMESQMRIINLTVDNLWQ